MLKFIILVVCILLKQAVAQLAALWLLSQTVFSGLMVHSQVFRLPFLPCLWLCYRNLYKLAHSVCTTVSRFMWYLFLPPQVCSSFYTAWPSQPGHWSRWGHCFIYALFWREIWEGTPCLLPGNVQPGQCHKPYRCQFIDMVLSSKESIGQHRSLLKNFKWLFIAYTHTHTPFSWALFDLIPTSFWGLSHITCLPVP